MAKLKPQPDTIKDVILLVVVVFLLVVLALVSLPIFNSLVDRSDAGGGPIYFACTSLSKTLPETRSIYHNESSYIQEVMDETGWTEERVRDSLEGEYNHVKYNNLTKTQRNRVNLAIKKAESHPDAMVGDEALNVSVKRDVGYNIDKTFVERNNSIYYCEMGYTGGA